MFSRVCQYVKWRLAQFYCTPPVLLAPGGIFRSFRGPKPIFGILNSSLFAISMILLSQILLNLRSGMSITGFDHELELSSRFIVERLSVCKPEKERNFEDLIDIADF